MTTLTIHTYPGNYRVHKALIAAQYNNIKINVPAGFEIDKDNQTKEFESKFPVKKVPAMDTPFGPLAESGAILRYIARLRPDTGLLGSSFYLQALVDQWIDYCGFEIEPSRATWLYPIWKIHEFNQKAYEASKEEIHKSLRLIDSHLATRTYLVGNQITLADIVVVTAFADLVKLVLTEADAKKYINFTRWFNTCVNQPQFAAVLGAVEFAKSETRANAGGEKKEEKAGGEKKDKEAGQQKKEKGQKTEKGKQKEDKQEKQEKQEKPKQEKPKQEKQEKGDKGKDEKPKQEKAKKEEKPKEAQPKQENPKQANKKESKPKKESEISKKSAQDTKTESKSDPPAKNFEHLPKSSLDLVKTKKLFFLNKNMSAKFFSEFWPQFDAQGYSFWHCSYKYDNEFSVFFLAGNLLQKWFQTLAPLSDYAFGSMLLTGETEDRPPWSLRGMWLFRGQDVPDIVKKSDQYDQFNWTKVDAGNAAVKQRIQFYYDVLVEKVEGETVLDRRHFR
jgi:elongation factor 1-gamma